MQLSAFANFSSAPQLLVGLLKVTLLGCAIGLAGCGNKGPLYLPSSPEAESTSPTEEAASPPADATEPGSTVSPTPDPQ